MKTKLYLCSCLYFTLRTFDNILESDGGINQNNAVNFKTSNTINLMGAFEVKAHSISEVSIEECINRI